jgi:hypothetical protein
MNPRYQMKASLTKKTILVVTILMMMDRSNLTTLKTKFTPFMED